MGNCIFLQSTKSSVRKVNDELFDYYAPSIRDLHKMKRYKKRVDNPET